jgi:hypothetical protein
VIHVFPAWPKEWNTQYKLLARGAFLVSASIEAGRVGFVELESLAGTECRMRNPFENGAALFRDGRAAEKLQESLLRFPTRKGERIVIVAADRTPADERRKV